MIEVVSFDVGGTLATATGDSFTSYVGSRSSLSRELFLERARTLLLTKDRFEETVIGELCRELGVDRSAWPELWSPAALVPLTGAAEVLNAIAHDKRIVTLSNVCRRDASDGEIERLFPAVSTVFRSFDIGATKPDLTAFLTVAEVMGVKPSQILHIGDDWRCDVQGALAAGAHAAYVGAPRDGVISGLDIGQVYAKLRTNREFCE